MKLIMPEQNKNSSSSTTTSSNGQQHQHLQHLSATSNNSTPINIPSIMSSLSIDLSSEDDLDSDGQPSSKWYKCGRIMWKIFTSQLGLVILLLCYSFAGAAIFKAIEGPNEQRAIETMEHARKALLEAMFEMAQLHNNISMFEGNVSVVLQEYEEKLTRMINHGISAGYDNIIWDYWGSLFFCATVFTTIGYGHITPSTSAGRIATMIYAVIGIPLFLVIMGKFGKVLTRLLKGIWKYVRMCYYARCCRVMRSRMKHSAPVTWVRAKVTCKKKPSEGSAEGGEIGNEAAGGATSMAGGTSSANNIADSKHCRVIQEVRRVSSQANLSNLQNIPSIGPPVMNDSTTSQQDLVRSVEDDDDSNSIDDFVLEEDFRLPPLLAFAITTVYIFIGAYMYTRWEPWTYLEAFYFLFVSVSTIGFGDIIPKHQKYFLATSAYIVLGLALVAMMINVLIEFFNKTIDLAKEKVADVGRHMGLDVDEYESRSRANSFMSPSPRPPLSRDHMNRHSPSGSIDAPQHSPRGTDRLKENAAKRRKKKRQDSDVDLATPASVGCHKESSKKRSPKRSSPKSSSPKRPSKDSTLSNDGVANPGFKDDAGVVDIKLDNEKNISDCTGEDNN